MSSEAARLLRSAAQSLRLPIDEAQIERLLAYLALLQRWNATYNLTAIRDPAAMVTQHLVDCMAVIGPLQRHVGDAAVRLLDVGSGGGLPGIVIAALNSRIEVTCVDAVGKKAAFVRQVSGELRLNNLHGAHSRVERLRSDAFDVITSRAFASLSDFVGLTGASLREGGIWMAMKGKRPDSEIAAVPTSVQVFHVEPLSVPGMEAERCLIWMRKSSSGTVASL